MPGRTKIPVPLEKEVQKSGIALLRALGWTVFRRNVGFSVATHKGKKRAIRYGDPGQSDTWGTLPDGRHFELEFKRPGKRPTLDQARWLWMMNSGDYGVAFWVDNTGTLERVARHLMAGGRIRYLDQDGRQYPDGWSPGDYDLV